MKKKKLIVVVSIVIHGAPRMTPGGRCRISKWMRERAIDLEKLGSDFGGTYRPRYYAVPYKRKAKHGY